MDTFSRMRNLKSLVAPNLAAVIDVLGIETQSNLSLWLKRSDDDITELDYLRLVQLAHNYHCVSNILHKMPAEKVNKEVAVVAAEKYLQLLNEEDSYMIGLFASGTYQQDLPPALQADEEVVLAYVKVGLALDRVPKEVRTEAVCRLAVQKEAFAIYQVPKEVMDFDMCRDSVAARGNMMVFAPRELHPDLFPFASPDGKYRFGTTAQKSDPGTIKECLLALGSQIADVPTVQPIHAVYALGSKNTTNVLQLVKPKLLKGARALVASSFKKTDPDFAPVQRARRHFRAIDKEVSKTKAIQEVRAQEYREEHLRKRLRL